MPKLPDNFLPAVLRGGYVGSPERRLAIAMANTVLGVGLGAQVDLGKADDEILSQCKEILTGIRRAASDPEVLRALETVHDASKAPDKR